MSGRRPIRTPIRQRLADLLRGPLTLVVWLAASVAVVSLVARRTLTQGNVGLARGLIVEASTPVTGFIDWLLVDLYESVHAGDVVAMLDDTDLLARLAIARAEIVRLSADVEAARAELVLEAALREEESSADHLEFATDQMRRHEEERRRLAVEATRQQLDALALRVDIGEDRVEQQRLEVRIERERELVTEGISSETRWDDLQFQLAATKVRLERNAVLLSETERAGPAIPEPPRDLERALPDTQRIEERLAGLREAIAVQKRNVEAIEAQRRHLLVRAGIDGQVSNVLARAGQAILPGEPIVLIANPEAVDIVVWLPERQAAEFDHETKVLVGRSHPHLPARVDSIAPTIEQLPRRLWRDPATPEYGRALVIATVPELALVPGEAVVVQLSPKLE